LVGVIEIRKTIEGYHYHGIIICININVWKVIR